MYEDDYELAKRLAGKYGGKLEDFLESIKSQNNIISRL